MPNDPYRGRTAPLTSKRCILYIYSTNIGTEYFNMVYTLGFCSSKCSLFHKSNVFGSCIIHILYTECAKIKKKNSGAKKVKRQHGCGKEYISNLKIAVFWDVTAWYLAPFPTFRKTLLYLSVNSVGSAWKARRLYYESSKAVKSPSIQKRLMQSTWKPSLSTMY